MLDEHKMYTCYVLADPYNVWVIIFGNEMLYLCLSGTFMEKPDLLSCFFRQIRFFVCR